MLLTATALALAPLDSSVMLFAIDVPRPLANLAAALRVATAPVPSVLDCSVTIDVLRPMANLAAALRVATPPVPSVLHCSFTIYVF